MRILVLGAGALGSLVGGLLSQHNDVTLLGRDPHMEIMRAAGLVITGGTELVARPDVTTSIKTIEPPDAVIVTVKSYDTEVAISDIRPLLKSDVPVLSLQNGLGNEEILQTILGTPNVVGGVTSHGVIYSEPGHIVHTGIGETVIGPFRNCTPELVQPLAQALNTSGIETTITDNIEGELWAKVAVNASINPITAITGLRNGSILGSPHLKTLLGSICDEVTSIILAVGIDVPCTDLKEKSMNVVKNTAENKSSMLQDIERGKRTEIDAINGVIIIEGKKFGVPTPMNTTMYTLVKGIEQTLKI